MVACLAMAIALAIVGRRQVPLRAAQNAGFGPDWDCADYGNGPVCFRHGFAPGPIPSGPASVRSAPR